MSMSTKITLGIVLFMIVFAATGLVLLNEGLLDVQARDGTGRMQIEFKAQKARSVEAGALLFLNNCSTCHGANGEGVPGKGLALNPDLFTKHWPAIQSVRTFNGTLHDFVKATVAAGRPVPSSYADSEGGFVDPMPTWSQFFGGPLRDDQVEDVTNFIMNWEAEALAGPILPPFPGIGADLTVALPTGDATRGAALFAGTEKLASGKPAPCQACHSLEPNVIKVGPSLAGAGPMAGHMVPGKSADVYLRESIQTPNAFIVPDSPTFANNGKSVMPEGLGNTMSPQDLADLIAYLLSLK